MECVRACVCVRVLWCHMMWQGVWTMCACMDANVFCLVFLWWKWLSGDCQSRVGMSAWSMWWIFECVVYILCGLLKKKEIWIYCQSLVYWKIVNGPGHAEKIMDFQKKVQKRREEIVLQHTIEFARILMFLSCAHSAHSPKLECSLGWFDFDLHFLASILFVMEHSIQIKGFAVNCIFNVANLWRSSSTI